jgi:hypothetical protein
MGDLSRWAVVTVYHNVTLSEASRGVQTSQVVETCEVSKAFFASLKVAGFAV